MLRTLSSGEGAVTALGFVRTISVASVMHGPELSIRCRDQPRLPPSSPANGSAERPPDDRLRRVIQYSSASAAESKRRVVLDPRFRGDDSSGSYLTTLAIRPCAADRWSSLSRA